jgi:hydroxyisourate hydrolase
MDVQVGENVVFSKKLQYSSMNLLTVVKQGENMRVRLERVAPAESAGHIGDFVLNDDGRLAEGAALRGGKDMSAGTYVFTFYVADYFASKGTFFPGTPFLDEVPIRFGIDNPDEHYHIPLLVSPWTYSTYRGS